MSRQTLRVLLIEDNVGDSRLIRRTLLGTLAVTFDVETADRLATGLERLRAGSVDVLLLDLSLPDSQGLETFRRVHQELPDLPIVVLTGLEDEQVAIEALQAGAQDYLAKGQVAGDVLARSLRYAVERSQLLLQARRAVHVRDEFLATAAHDLKTPLTAIKGHAQLLARRIDRVQGDEGPRLREGLRQIDASAAKMLGMLDELLDLARLQVGQQLELHCLPTDLVALTRFAAAEHQQAAPAHTIVFRSDAPALVGFWDPVRLERVIDNLINNAAKYSPQGGEITVEIVREASAAILRVRDQGIGIPATDLPHVFERFRRGSNATNISVGMGIGLAGVRETVERHGGTVAVESQEGEGTIVIVRLPLENQ